MTDVHLEVTKAYPTDCGRGIVRISPRALHRLGVDVGDAIEVKGNDRTVARVRQLDNKDWNGTTARLDWNTRRNVGAAVGDRVSLHATTVHEANRVVVEPPQEPPKSVGKPSPQLIKTQLLIRTLLKGDFIPIAAPSEQRVYRPVDFEEFRVVEQTPTGAAAVTGDTEIELKADR